MIQNTKCSLRKYNIRSMHLPYRRRSSFYQQPSYAHCKTPLANKQPEEYGETWNQRTGVLWHSRMRRRNQYRHWPWVTWKDDFLYHHETQSSTRTFSAKHATSNSGAPRWNLYEMVGQDYKIPCHYPVSTLAPIISLYTSKVWCRGTLDKLLATVQEKWKTIEDVQENFANVLEWNGKTHSVPHGFLTHLKYLVDDVVLLQRKKENRKKLHEQGILRTDGMQRYFALPYVRSGPAMPVKLAQPVGLYPQGTYLYMMGDQKIHPFYRIDKRLSTALYPQ